MIRSPNVSAVVPARNEEATIARAVESLAAQPEIHEIIVVNDRSTDRTASVLAELAARIPQLRIVEGEPLPPGWTGKNYALAQGVARASGEWLLFTDADVQHLPGSTARALADAKKSGAALVSYSPEQETPSWWERVVIPFVYCRLAVHFPYRKVMDPDSSYAAANGQYLLIRREAYDAIGGHAAIRGEVVEDVALARRAKQAGHRICFGPGQGIARTRMYTSLAAMWEGWTKNLYVLVGGNPQAAALELLEAFPILSAILLAWGFYWKAFAFLGLALLAGLHIEYGFALRRNRFPVSRILYYLPGALWYSAALVTSARQHVRGSVVWKGRAISAGTR